MRSSRWARWCGLLALASCATPQGKLNARFIADEEACAGGDRKACLEAGQVHQHGWWGNPRDLRTAAARYQAGCHMPDAETACVHLSGIANDRAVLSASPELALSTVRASCDAGYLPACMTLATWYGGAEVGLPRDLDRARRLYARVCREAARLSTTPSAGLLFSVMFSCGQLGAIYSSGQGVPVDKVTGMKFNLVSAQLRAEANEASWLSRDESALRARESKEKLALLQQEERARQKDQHATALAVLKGLNLGLESMQGVLRQHQQFRQDIAALKAAGPRKSRHYEPPPAAVLPRSGGQTTPSPAKVVQAAPGPTPAQANAAAVATKLAECLARPATQLRTAQTNPFQAHVTGYVSLLRQVNKCPESPGSAWKECIGMNAIHWPDYDAQRDEDDFNRRQLRVAAGEACLYNQSLGTTRSFCVSNGRAACWQRLEQNVADVRCSLRVLPLVWAAEVARNDADAKTKQDDDCHRRFQ